MKIAIPQWQGRVSPVFDVSTCLLVADWDGEVLAPGQEYRLTSEGVPQRAAEVAALEVEVLICGAVSRPMEMALADAGIEVVPHICGPVVEVLRAYVGGTLDGETYRMPGCCGRRRRRGGCGGGGRSGRRRGQKI